MAKLNVLVGGNDYRAGHGVTNLVYCAKEKEEESRLVLSKVSVVVGAANGSRNSALYRYTGYGIYYRQDECT
jgi:hypothetical protein